MLLRFSHIMIYSHRQDETVQWYCEKLGYEIDYNAPGKYASLHHKNLGRLAVHVVDSPSKVTSPLPYLLCDDIHATIAELRAKNITVSGPEREGESPWFADFVDLVGNRWGIEEK
jgi:hypothetical protein